MNNSSGPPAVVNITPQLVAGAKAVGLNYTLSILKVSGVGELRHTYA